jgi:heme/copper-type cytochrome/quinol oxidase subunit 2
MSGGRRGKGNAMTTFALTVIAQSTQNTQAAPDEGIGAGLIIGTIVAVILVAVVLWLIFTRATKASRGGVQPMDDDREHGNPPIESIERGR